MNPNVVFALMIIVSFTVGTILTLALVRFSLFLGVVLKRRYGTTRYTSYESLASANLDNPSNHSRKKRQQSNQQIEATRGIKSVHQGYHRWIIGLIDRVLQPIYWHLNCSQHKQYQDTYTCTKDNSRNLKPLIDAHGGNSTTGYISGSTKTKQNHFAET